MADKNKSILKGKNYIKGAKAGYLNKARFQNEVNFYKKVQNHKLKYLLIPEVRFESSKEELVLQYIEGEKQTFPSTHKLISAYSEFQNLENNFNSNKNLLSKITKGYFYKICIVSLFKLGSKFRWKEILQIWLLFFRLNFHSTQQGRAFRLHGDLYLNNIIITETEKIAFIDFENTFTNKKWPLEEIVGYCFFFDDENIQFNEIYLQEYICQNSHILKLDEIQLLYQIRFGVLHQAIKSIVQTQGDLKRQAYKDLLYTVCSRKKFQSWLAANLAGTLQTSVNSQDK